MAHRQQVTLPSGKRSRVEVLDLRFVGRGARRLAGDGRIGCLVSCLWLVRRRGILQSFPANLRQNLVVCCYALFIRPARNMGCLDWLDWVAAVLSARALDWRSGGAFVRFSVTAIRSTPPACEFPARLVADGNRCHLCFSRSGVLRNRLQQLASSIV
jgi:hypothetical protein